MENPQLYFIQVIVVMFSICLHELGHAIIAEREGDPTPRDYGHMSMNPLVQMGSFSIIMLLIFGISWGAVPVQPSYFKNKWSHFRVAIAGPAMNILLFILFGLISAVLMFMIQNGNISASEGLMMAVEMTTLGCYINAALFVLNMLPIPGLDGWICWGYFLPAIENASESTKGMLSTFGILLVLILFWKVIFGISLFLQSLWMGSILKVLNLIS